MAALTRLVNVRSLAISLALAAVLGMGLSVHAGPIPVAAQQIDRATVVQQFLADSNRGDVDAAMASFTDAPNALLIAWALCGRATPCIGTAAIRAFQERALAIHQISTATDLQVSGAIVTGRFESRSDTFRAAGAERIVGTFIAQVPQNKIAGFVAQTDQTDAQTAQNAGTQPSSAQVDRAAVVQQSYDARNRGDVDAALATFTDTALVIAGPPCDQATPCIGAAVLQSWLVGAVPNHTNLTITSSQVSGTIVTGWFEVRNDRIRSAGIDRIVQSFIAQIPNDKILVFVALPDFADAQTAQNFGVTP